MILKFLMLFSSMKTQTLDPFVCAENEHFSKDNDPLFCCDTKTENDTVGADFPGMPFQRTHRYVAPNVCGYASTGWGAADPQMYSPQKCICNKGFDLKFKTRIAN